MIDFFISEHLALHVKNYMENNYSLPVMVLLVWTTKKKNGYDRKASPLKTAGLSWLSHPLFDGLSINAMTKQRGKIMILQPFTLQIHLPTPLTGHRKDVILKIKWPDYFSCRQNWNMISTAVIAEWSGAKIPSSRIMPGLLFGQAVV